SPDSPSLYNAQLRLFKSGTLIDSIWSYFGANEYSINAQPENNHSILLNDETLPQLAIEHYGFWPDGMITPPSDKAVYADIQAIKNMGFNLIINRSEMPSDRWFYWCDKIGILVWQNYKSDYNQQHKPVEDNLYKLSTHPSLVALTGGTEMNFQSKDKMSVHSAKYFISPKNEGKIQILYINPDTAISSFDFDNYNYSSIGLGDEIEKAWEKVEDVSQIGSDPEKFSIAAIAYNTSNYNKIFVLAQQFARENGISTIVYPQLCDLPGQKLGLQTEDRRAFKVNLEQMLKINHSLMNYN
ncbi:MAG: hypothetical protein DWQ10_06450, partial [Calditrichaeota bacterium]